MPRQQQTIYLSSCAFQSPPNTNRIPEIHLQPSRKQIHDGTQQTNQQVQGAEYNAGVWMIRAIIVPNLPQDTGSVHTTSDHPGGWIVVDDGGWGDKQQNTCSE